MRVLCDRLYVLFVISLCSCHHLCNPLLAAAAVGAIFVIIPYLYAVVKTRSLSFLVSSSAVLAAPTAKPSSFPGRTGFGGGRKENTKGTLPFIN